MAPRIASLVPAATEAVCALGAGGQLCGVTQWCRRFPGAAGAPVLARPAVDTSGMSCAQVGEAGRRLAAAGAEPFALDAGALAAARPDVVIAQDECGVCAPHAARVREALGGAPGAPELLVLGPRDMAGALGAISEVARAAGREAEGRRLRASLEARIAAAGAGAASPRPRVLAVEWLDPPYTAGHWVPDMIEAAGGECLASAAGERSRPMAEGEAAALDPDVAVIMPCGMGAAQAAAEYRGSLGRDPAWLRTRAARAGRVYAVDAGRHFSGPGIGIAGGVESLARVLRPGHAGAGPETRLAGGRP